MFAYYSPEWESLASRIVGRWCPSFSGSTGLQLPDTTGRNHGTLTNFSNNGNNAYVTSPDRLAMEFDGTNDAVIVPDRPSISITGTNLAFSAWVFQTGAAAYKQIFAKASGTGTVNRSYGFYITGGSGPGAANSLGFETRTSSTVDNGFGTIATNVWTHCVGTYNGSVMTWYLQGDQVGTAAQSGTIATQASDFFIGQFATGGFSAFKGQIDDAIVFNGSLTASEVRFIYEQGRGGGMLYQPPRRRSYYAQLAAAFLIACNTGEFTLTGQPANLLAGRVITAQQAAFILSGQATGIIAARTIAADTADYTAQSRDAALLAARLIAGDAGAYNLVGNAADTLASRSMTADRASFALTGYNAATLLGRLLDAGAAAYSLNGSATDLLTARRINAEQAVFLATGNDAGLLLGRKLGAATGQFILVASDVNLTTGSGGAAPYYYLFLLGGSC